LIFKEKYLVSIFCLGLNGGGTECKLSFAVVPFEQYICPLVKDVDCKHFTRNFVFTECDVALDCYNDLKKSLADDTLSMDKTKFMEV